jgi:hypothetical protein
MDRKRKVYAPFSQTSEAGVTQTPVEGYIDVNQMIYPTVNTGVVNEKGQWAGVKSDDDNFTIMGTDLAVPNTQLVLAPAGDPDFIDMTGFKDIMIAVKVTNTGNYAFSAVMGPDTNRFANLAPVNSGENLQGAGTGVRGPADRLDVLFEDGADDMSADVWHVFTIFNVLSGQKNLQFKITNSSGGNSDIQFAFMRLV